MLFLFRRKPESTDAGEMDPRLRGDDRGSGLRRNDERGSGLRRNDERGSGLRRNDGWVLVALAAAVILALALASSTAYSQQAVADSLWRTGNRSEALVEYRRILASDSLSVRANFRVAVDLADRNVDSALVLLRNARMREPLDPDLRISEATYLSWAGRYDAAVSRFDSILAVNPSLTDVRLARARTLSWKGDFAAAENAYSEIIQRDASDAAQRRDARFGLAQVAAWKGSLDDAADRYSSILSESPDEVRSLVGLAAVRSWQSRPFAASDLLRRALTHDSENRDAKRLLATVARSRAPAFEFNASWSHDSDDNNVAWQTATQTFLLRDGLKVWASAGSQHATDPVRATTRLLGEAGGTLNHGIVRATAALGARRLDVSRAPTGESNRTEITWRANAGVRLRPNLSVGAGVSRLPFDEIAALLARGIMLTSYDGSVEWSPAEGVAIGAGGGVLDLSDGNRRTSASLRASKRVIRGLTFGLMARTFSFEQDGDGYFTPERFILGDLFGNLERESGKFSYGITAGGGVQSLGPDAPTQGQWHFDTRINYQLSARASVSVFGGSSTSAAASAVGAFRYQTAGVSARVWF